MYQKLKRFKDKKTQQNNDEAEVARRFFSSFWRDSEQEKKIPSEASVAGVF